MLVELAVHLHQLCGDPGGREGALQWPGAGRWRWDVTKFSHSWILTNQTKISWLTTMLQVLACWIIFIDICIYYLTCFRKPSQCSQHQQRKTRRSWIWRISCRRFIRSWDLLGCRLQRRQTMNNAITWIITDYTYRGAAAMLYNHHGVFT